MKCLYLSAILCSIIDLQLCFNIRLWDELDLSGMVSDYMAGNGLNFCIQMVGQWASILGICSRTEIRI
jgi:hypothetical protein